MIYSLWDVEIGNAVAEYRSGVEMAALVRALVGERGPATADDLDLSINREDLVQVGSLTGKDLIAWAEGILAGAGEDGPGRSDDRSSSSYASRHDRRTGGFRERTQGLPLAARGVSAFQKAAKSVAHSVKGKESTRTRRD